MSSFSRRQRAASRSDHNIAGLYDLERTLGSGHFAVVKLARHVFTGENVAVKVIDKTKLDEVAEAHLFQEVRCMKLVQHPNVVRLYEVIDTQTKLYLILEYGDGGDMYDYIMKHEGQGISEDKARHYFKQIVSAIDYCHRLHVVHRDLKPENVIFFKTQDVAKLTDFGFSNSFLPGEKLYTSCGSLAYSAPEILLGDSYDAPAVDVWSLGVILYMMVCGTGPFSHSNDSETLTMIMDCKYDLPDHLSADLRGLISKMLVREPQSRIALECIADHDWLRDEVDTVMPTPLISELNISKDIHMVVIQKMEDGNIASKSDIKRSLEDNQYDHITATYFLLAERFLKKRYGSSAVHVRLEERHTYPYDDIYLTSESNLELTADSGLTCSLGSDLEKRDYSTGTDGKQDSRTNFTTETSPLALASQVRSNRSSYNSGLYKKTLSSPNILNEISEECESEADDSPASSPKARHQALRRRKFESKRSHGGCKLSPIHSRRSSCSSSDDDDSHSLRASQSAITSLISNGRPLQSVQEKEKDREGTSSGQSGTQKNFVDEIVTKLYTDPAFITDDEQKQDKENDSSLINKLPLPIIPYKTKPLRHLSDTNLYILYSYNSDSGRKYLSDTNLQVFNMNLKNAKKSGFNCSRKDSNGVTIYAQLSSPSMIDFNDKSLQIDSLKTNLCNTIDDHKTSKSTKEEFSSLTKIQDSDTVSITRSIKATRRESLQSTLSSQRESKSSLKYVYNEANNNSEATANDKNDNPSENLSNSNITDPSDSESLQPEPPQPPPAQPVSYMFQGRTLAFVESACCTIV